MKILDKIIEASANLFMNYGYKSISMDDIASALGMSKKTIYKHVSNKDKLIKLTLIQYLQKEKKIVQSIVENSENAIDEFTAIGRHVIKMVRKLKPTLIFDIKKYHSTHWKLIEEHHYLFIHDIIRKNIERGIEEGLFRANIKPEIIAKLYIGKSITIADENNFPLETFSREDLMKQHLLYHLYGILSAEGFKMIEKYELDAH